MPLWESSEMEGKQMKKTPFLANWLRRQENGDGRQERVNPGCFRFFSESPGVWGGEEIW